MTCSYFCWCVIRCRTSFVSIFGLPELMSRSCSLLCMKWFPFWPRFAWTILDFLSHCTDTWPLQKSLPLLLALSPEARFTFLTSLPPQVSRVSNTTIPNVTEAGSCLERTEYEAAKTVKNVRRGQRQRAAFLFVLFQSNNTVCFPAGTWACTDLRHFCDSRNKHYCLPKYVRKKHKEWLMKEAH